MDVAIVIVTRNTRELVSRAIDSVLHGHAGLAVELTVVDNGSADDTVAALTANYPGVRVLSAGRNLGFAKAVNWGAKGTTAEFILLLNSDAVLKPEALPTAISWMRAHADCAVAGAQLLNPDGTPQNSIANFPTLATELLNKSLLRRLFPKRYPGKERRHPEPLEVETVIGAFMLIRRATWDALGGLDERFFFFLEETDFCLQARRAGSKIMHLPQVAVFHGQGQTAKKTAAAARLEYWRSRYAYFAKNYGRGIQIVLALGLFLRLAVEWIFSGLLVILSLRLNQRWHDKWRVFHALWVWHWRGCPNGVGLPR